MAHDVYATLGPQWPLTVFASIEESEQRHMDTVLLLLQAAGVADPRGPGVGERARVPWSVVRRTPSPRNDVAGPPGGRSEGVPPGSTPAEAMKTMKTTSTTAARAILVLLIAVLGAEAGASAPEATVHGAISTRISLVRRNQGMNGGSYRAQTGSPTARRPSFSMAARSSASFSR